jgi:hypothetical protein
MITSRDAKRRSFVVGTGLAGILEPSVPSVSAQVRGGGVLRKVVLTRVAGS